MNPGDESLPLSALQHWLFCPRQCALIHVERIWAENRLTAEGRALHERADSGRPETRDGVRTLRAVQVASAALGLHGVADVVEMRGRLPYPVEYKRGRPKTHRADEVQLCTQGMCLEEMTGHAVPEGALFYGQSRRRQVVPFDETLRDLVRQVTTEVHAALAEGRVPPAAYELAKCEACSLREPCRPEARCNGAVSWLARRLDRMGVPE